MRILLLCLLLCACAAPPPQIKVKGREGAKKTVATERSKRRAYDGAPPVIPHLPMGADCVSCHTKQGMFVEGIGLAPPMPHTFTPGMSEQSRCEQCHVWKKSEKVFQENKFTGAPQDLRNGNRLYPGAPPIMPHQEFMHEDCLSCHSGDAAREEIRTSHPERIRCRQCHAESNATSFFSQYPD